MIPKRRGLAPAQGFLATSYHTCISCLPGLRPHLGAPRAHVNVTICVIGTAERGGAIRTKGHVEGLMKSTAGRARCGVVH